MKNLRNKNSRGITLVELIVVIFIITIFSTILISDFPKIRRQYALSRATYKLAQNLRRVQDMGLSGVKLTNDAGQPVLAKGYGIYIDVLTQPAEQYILYADNCPTGAPDLKYGIDASCSPDGHDFIIDTIDVNEDKAEVFIKEIKNIDLAQTSINFEPPNPYIKIENLNIQKNNIEIVLALSSDPSTTRAVSINTAGLIEVK